MCMNITILAEPFLTIKFDLKDIFKMSKYLILGLLLLAVAVSSAANQCGPHPSYTQNALALSWPGDFCGTNGNCISAYDKEWDGKSFGIHGLWPSYDSKDLSCVMNGKNPDPYCNYKYYFNQQLLSGLTKDLNTYWPQWGKNNYDSFHKNEWNKHGVCYLKLLKERFASLRYTDDQLFQSYFSNALRLTKGHNRVTKFRFLNKADLAKELKIANADSFYVACKNSYIFEVRLCFTINKAGQQQPIKCFNRDLQTQRARCPYPLNLKQKVARK